MKRFLAAALAAFALWCVPAFAQTQQPPFARVDGDFIASRYNWEYGQVRTLNSVGATSGTITLSTSYVTLRDGSSIYPFAITAPVAIDQGSAVSETVIPTTVSGCGTNAPNATCSITATFLNAHGPSAVITSGTFGLQEAINDAAGFNGGGLTANLGGQVIVDRSWSGTSSQIYGNAAGNTTGSAPTGNVVVFSNVSIVDKRGMVPVYWNPAPTVTTILATPATLTAQLACDATHTFCSDASVAGSASWGGTVYGCITYVDIMGNESPTCSATASFTSAASKAIDIASPAASTGAVGWKPYLSVSAGSYALAYSIPLVTQAGVSTGVCTLTTLETTTPACAVANATYGQAASTTGAGGLFTAGGAQITGYPVVTSQLAPEVGSASATAYNPNDNGHTVYSYVPGSHLGISGVVAYSQPFPIAVAAQTTVGEVIGTIHLPPGFMNYVGRSIRICGLAFKTSTTADTISNIQLWWDAEGSNVTAGTPVQLTDARVTATLTGASNYQFCQNISTTVAASTATGGTIIPGQGYIMDATIAAGTVHAAAPEALVAAVGSLNLALNSRIEILYNHTTGTDGSGVTLQGVTVEVLN